MGFYQVSDIPFQFIPDDVEWKWTGGPRVREVALTLPGSSAAPGQSHMPLTASPAFPTHQL